MPSADWYFDFISPFAYLQSERLALARAALSIRYRPVLFAVLLDAHGHKGPAEIPAKRAFTYRHVVWQAKAGHSAQVPPEHPFNPLPLLRLAIACDCAPRRCSGSSASCGAIGGCRTCRSNGRSSTHDLGLPDADARIADPAVKTRSRRNTEEAISRGVFGVPTLAIGRELFWGADATTWRATYVAAAAATTIRIRTRRRAARRGVRKEVRPGAEEEDARGRHGELTIGVRVRRGRDPCGGFNVQAPRGVPPTPHRYSASDPGIRTQP
jgi:2-hydroxychromene-2-carboxylate isomerase